MNSFESFNLSKQLLEAIKELNYENPTPIQAEAFKVILSGRDMVGIAQTGTGKTFAYMLPLLSDLKFSKQPTPRILVLVPTRELVIQLVEQIKNFTKFTNIRVLGVYGGTNINTQKQEVVLGTDILVATPGRLYDLALTNVLKLKEIKKLVIDEVDVMLDLGFRFQLENIFELLPQKRQNLMFSATMTEEVDALIDGFFVSPIRISIAVSGTPLENIEQACYPVHNYYTKINLLKKILENRQEFNKVLVFVSDKKNADRLFESLEEVFNSEIGIIHSNKSQNYRIRSVQDFDKGKNRIIIATDVMARGIDLDNISHVINFDTPAFPENYMHRIGRTGRAEKMGKSLLFYTEKEEKAKVAIEALMDYKIPIIPFPSDVAISSQLLPEERQKAKIKLNRNTKIITPNNGFHEKSEKNKKTNQGGSYKRDIAKKYKKPKTKGDKNYNKAKSRKK